MKSCLPSWAGSPDGRVQPGHMALDRADDLLGPGDPVRGGRHGQHPAQRDHGEDEGQRALPGQRFDVDVLGPVHAEEHDDEEEQHDDGAGVDDDLHGGQEVGLLLNEEDGHPEERHHEEEGGVHRVRRGDHAHGADEDHQGGGPEHNGVGHGGAR